MRINSWYLLFTLDLFNFRNIDLLTGCAPDGHWVNFQDHVAAADVPTAVNCISELFLEMQPDFTGFVQSEPLAQANSLGCHGLEFD